MHERVEVQRVECPSPGRGSCARGSAATKKVLSALLIVTRLPGSLNTCNLNLFENIKHLVIKIKYKSAITSRDADVHAFGKYIGNVDRASPSFLPRAVALLPSIFLYLSFSSAEGVGGSFTDIGAYSYHSARREFSPVGG